MNSAPNPHDPRFAGRPARARAHPNIALIKYWGKRDPALNLPAAGSISITLDRFEAVTEVRLGAAADRFRLDGADAPDAAARVFAWLDHYRDPTDPAARAEIESHNNFPTAAGLASSAAGFAALATAAFAALGRPGDPRELSLAARRGSASAARSIFGGFVELCAGRLDDGSDAYAEPLLGADDWPLRVVVAITTRRAKAASSRAGMERSRATSPFFPAWVRATEEALPSARQAIENRDFERLASLAEASCLRMHAVMLATDPGLIYWNGATVECLHLLRRLRRAGTPVFFTVDAGPQVKAICLPQAAPAVADELAAIGGVDEVVTVGLGAGAALLDGGAGAAPSLR